MDNPPCLCTAAINTCGHTMHLWTGWPYLVGPKLHVFFFSFFKLNFLQQLRYIKSMTVEIHDMKNISIYILHIGWTWVHCWYQLVQDTPLACKSVRYLQISSPSDATPMPGLLALQDAKESQLQEPEHGYAIPGVSFTAEDGFFFWMFEGKVKLLQLGKEGKVGWSNNLTK